MRPSQYFLRVAKWDNEDDPEAEPSSEDIDCASLDNALARAKDISGYAAVYERVGVLDITPREDGTGILWDWESRLIHEE